VNTLFKKGKLNILIDGQFGSTGKGLFAAYLSKHYTIDIAVSISGPNAGHTFYLYGEKCVVKQLPVSAIINPDSFIYLPSGSIINPSILLKELDLYKIDKERLYIHKNATIISDEDILFEKKGPIQKISSTQNGVGSALARKINRTAKVAKDIKELQEFIQDFDLATSLEKGLTAFLEVPQGYSLSLNSKFYPYCTSRNITVQGALNECDLHPAYLGNVFMTIRTYPIRVGNLPNGYSGSFYDDSVETSWEDLKLATEYTTNTKRVRRVASFSFWQYKDALRDLKPDYVFLNFCNYLNKEALNTLLTKLPEVTHLGFGPKTEEVISKEAYLC